VVLGREPCRTEGRSSGSPRTGPPYVPTR
jgi:hypothetical protein